jgi:hypothetical protein
MTFLECVNRIFRSNGIIKGDDDDIESFSDTAHNATIQLAQIAVQDELNDLVSDNVIPYEVTEGTIMAGVGSRVYSLANDFVRFYGRARLYNATANRYLYEFPGGRDALAGEVATYKTASGDPAWWYFEPTTTKKIGFYQVPNTAVTYTYDYEKSVAVSVSSDILPFHSDPEAQAFSQAAGRRFKALFEENPDVDNFIKNDATYTSARSRIWGLLKGRNAYTRYGAILR